MARGRRTVGFLPATAALLAAAVAGAGGSPASAGTQTACTPPPGAEQLTTSYPQDSHASFWTVPADVHSVCVVVVGASGSDSTATYQGNPLGGAGGSGARVVAKLAVEPGQVYALGAGAAAGDLVSYDASSRHWSSQVTSPYSFQGGLGSAGGGPGGYASVVALWAPNPFADPSQQSYFTGGHLDTVAVVAGGGGGVGGSGATSGPDGLPGPGTTGGNGGTPDGRIGAGAGGGGATGSGWGTGGVGFDVGGTGSDGDLDETWDTWASRSPYWLGRGGAGAGGVQYNGAVCDAARFGGWSGGGGGGGGWHGGGGGGRGTYGSDANGCLTSEPGGGGGGGSSYVDPTLLQPGYDVGYSVANHDDPPSITLVWAADGAADTTAPTISGVPAAATVPATSPAGAVYSYAQPTATDDVDGPVAVVCTPAAGSTFPLGTTTVSCSASDAAGNTATASFTITVVAANRPPAAAFNETVSGLAVSFDASGSSDSDGTIASYAWDFGDGSSGSGVSPSHAYVAGGTYTVTLTVTDDASATGSTSRSVLVSTLPPVNRAPTASFTTSTGGLSVAFDAGGSRDPDGSVASYAWDFGDGAGGSGATVTHTYGGGGTYDARLTVTDDGGATGSVTHQVSVVAPVTTAPQPPAQPAPPKLVDLPPHAHITVSATRGNRRTSFVFGSLGSLGKIAGYAWDFGDGSRASTSSAATHVYGALGTFTATLTVTDTSGRTSSDSATVVVKNAPPVPAFAYHARTGRSVAFDGASSFDPDGRVRSYRWSFGDGAAAVGRRKIVHRYRGTKAHYTVTLEVVDDSGARVHIRRAVSVRAGAGDVSDLESIAVTDAPGLTPPGVVDVNEPISVGGSVPSLIPPSSITVIETIGAADGTVPIHQPRRER
ncbi:MAG TPA: PKD domain-containing protein [Gaiellaceae bacterium]|nr:PKD domain-containing protein [Gaiellaceae bacterium]